MKEFKDKSGRIVKPGDIIVYAVSYGRSPGLSYGRVLAITQSKSEWDRKTKVKVIGVDKSYDGIFRANTKPGFLEYSERMVVITDFANVPNQAFKKLMAIPLPENDENP